MTSSATHQGRSRARNGLLNGCRPRLPRQRRAPLGALYPLAAALCAAALVPACAANTAAAQGRGAPGPAVRGSAAATRGPAARGPAAPGTGRAAAAAVPKLTLAQMAGQRVIYSYSGLTPPASLFRLIRRGEVGGVIFFGQNISSKAQIAGVASQLEQANASPGNPLHAV